MAPRITCPVFRPTLEEFSNFDAYLSRTVEPELRLAGLAKIIPPAGWAWNGRAGGDSAAALDKMVVADPIQQCVSGRRGVYSVSNLAKPSRPASVFKALAQGRSAEDRTAPREGDDEGRVRHRFWRSLPAQSPAGTGATSPRSQANLSHKPARAPIRCELRAILSSTFTSPTVDFTGLTTTADAPVYGADIPGTLFGDADVPWNVGKLPCVLRQSGVEVPGVTQPMLYFGSWPVGSKGVALRT